MGKLNFRGYLILRFYPTREICENLMHAKNMCFTVDILSNKLKYLGCYFSGRNCKVDITCGTRKLCILVSSVTECL